MKELEIIIEHLMNGEAYFPEAFSVSNEDRIVGLDIIFERATYPDDLYIAVSLFHNFLRIFRKEDITINNLAYTCSTLAKNHLYQVKDSENYKLNDKFFKLVLVFIKHIVRFQTFTMLDYINVLGGDDTFNPKNKNSLGHILYMNLMTHKTFAYLKPSEQFVAIYMALDSLEIDDISSYGFDTFALFEGIDLVKKENVRVHVEGLKKFSLCKSEDSFINRVFVSGKNFSQEINFFDTYIVQDKIGEGSFSEVYKVTKEGKTFCAKTMPLEQYVSVLKPILTECIAMNKFKGLPGIATIHDMFFINQNKKDLCVFVMDMYDKINSKSMRNLLTLKKFLKGIFRGISLIHKLGYVHGDCKKDNYVIDEEGNGVIIDFSLLIKNDQRNIHDIYTFGYRSPEICEYYPIHCSDDIWAIGVSILDILFPDYVKTVLLMLPLGKRWKDSPERLSVKCSKKEEFDACSTTRLAMMKTIKNQDEDLYELLEKIFCKRQERPTADEILKMPFFS